MWSQELRPQASGVVRPAMGAVGSSTVVGVLPARPAAAEEYPRSVPSTCTSLGAGCGQVGDGYGGSLNCGLCVPPSAFGVQSRAASHLRRVKQTPYGHRRMVSSLEAGTVKVEAVTPDTEYLPAGSAAIPQSDEPGLATGDI